MVISKQGGVQLVRWSYRSKSGWVWLIPLSSPNDAAVEESSSKMRLFQKFSRCGWCWKFFKGAAVPEVLSKVRMMAEGSSKTRLFISPSGSRVNGSPLRGDVCWIFLQRSGAAGSRCMVRLWWVPLQLAAVWVPLERNEISVHGAAPSMHGAVASTFFLNGFPHVPEWCRCTLSSSEEMTLLFLKGTAASVLVFQWCGYTLHSSTDRKNPLLSDHLSPFFFFLVQLSISFSPLQSQWWKTP